MVHHAAKLPDQGESSGLASSTIVASVIAAALSQVTPRLSRPLARSPIWRRSAPYRVINTSSGTAATPAED